jgi:hypothetical protein
MLVADSSDIRRASHWGQACKTLPHNKCLNFSNLAEFCSFAGLTPMRGAPVASNCIYHHFDETYLQKPSNLTEITSKIRQK